MPTLASMLFYTYIIFEVAAFLVALWQFPKMRHSSYRYFVPYLFFIVVYEYGNLQNWFSINHSNLYISNITISISFLFNGLFLASLLRTPQFKKGAKVAIALSVPFAVINMAFFQGFWRLDTATILLQYLIIIVLSGLHFFELLRYTADTLSIVKVPAFWLNTGLFFFCILNFLVYSSFAYSAYKNDYSYFILFASISNVAIAVLYSCLCICFLSIKKNHAG